MKENANNQNAKHYDEMYSIIKGLDVVSEEIELIKSLVAVPAKVLDIGCGTGRHVIPLLEEGYEITGIDSSEEMLARMKKKVEGRKNLDKLHIMAGDFFNSNLKPKTYDLIILMWNSLAEVAMNHVWLENLFEKMKLLLKEDGKILINIDDTRNINLPHIDHTLTHKIEDKLYKSEWKVENFDSLNNITTSKETIRIYDLEGNLKSESSGFVDQKWWSLKDIEQMATKFNLKLEERHINSNKELYLVLLK